MKKQQTTEMISATQEMVIEGSDKQNLKKIIEYQDEINDNDAGYITSSNDSLYTEDSTTDEHANDDEKWKFNNLNDEKTLRFIKEVESEMTKIPEEQHREWLIQKCTRYYSSVMPQSLIELWASFFFDGDTGISIDVKPDWLDIDKFRRGQKFAFDNIMGVSYANVISLFAVLSIEDGLKPLIFTGASSTPYTAFKRYLSTATRFVNWYLTDPWTAGTQAYNDIRAVRRIHAMIRKKIQETSCEEYAEKTKIKDPWCPTLSQTRRDMESTCPVPKPGQCPYLACSNFPRLKKHELSQGEMASTQFAFTGIQILNPKFFGMHDATDEDLEAYCHLWRGLGYLLGIDDDFNFCRGTLEDVRTRSRDFLEYWLKPNLRVISPEWEHMMRCMVEGLQYYFPGSTYETCLLDLAEIMNLHLPRTYKSLSYSQLIKQKILRFYFNHVSKLSSLKSFVAHQMNASVEKAWNYDEQKHQELKEKSAKTMDFYLESKNHKSMDKWNKFITVICIVISSAAVAACMHVGMK